MASIEFESDNTSGFKSREFIGRKVTPSTIRWLIKTGLVKTEMQAGYLLVFITATCFALAVWIIYANFLSQQDPRNAGRSVIETDY